MQVTAGFGVDHPANGAVRTGLWKSLTVIPMLLSGLLVAPAGAAPEEPAPSPSAPTAILEGLRATLLSRWEFQKRFPLASKAFAKELTEAERAALQARLLATPPTPAATVADGVIPLPDLWREFTLGLCAEARQPGSGEAELLAAAQRAVGSVPVNFELARILQGAGMFNRALVLQKETQRAMLEQGYARIPELAKMELWRARQALADGRYQAARHSMEFTARLDPFAPWAPLLALEIHLREHAVWEWDLGEVWARIGEAALQARHYDSLSLLLLNLSRMFRLGLGVFGCLCVAVLFGRHFFRIAHPLAERLPHPVEMRVRYLAIALVPVSLAVGGAGYAVLCMAAAVLLWRHSSVQERALLKAVLTGLAIMPILLLWEQSMGRHLDPARGVHYYHKAYGRGMEPVLAAQVASLKPRDEEDSLYRALSASLLFKKQGNLLRAGEASREALRLSQRDGMANALATVHLGNLHLLAFDYGKAATQYSTAREGVPGMVEAWFNGSQAELYANRSNKHKQFLDKAAELDPQRVTAWLKDNDELFPSVPPARKAMDPMLGAGQAWRAMARGALDLEFLAIPVRAGIFEVPAAWLIGAVFLLSLGLFLRFRNFSHHVAGRDLFECKICNRIMCRTCRKGVHCQACFKAVAGVHDARLRTELVASLRNRAGNREGRAGRILDLCLPGLGRLYLGERSGRFAWPLAASLAIGLLVGARNLLMEYPAFALGGFIWLAGLPILLVYGLHHLAFLRSTRARVSRPSMPISLEREAVA